MNMTPRFQKLTLLAHVAFSVGWFGAIIPYLALVIAGLTSHDTQVTCAACLSMNLIGWYILVPFSFAALLSGLVQSLFTQWGLFWHWWILAKLGLTIFAMFVLLQHMREVSRMTKEAMLSGTDFRPDLIHATGGLLVLLTAMTLSMFKPWGMTPYGRRRLSQTYIPSHSSGEVARVHQPEFATRKLQWPHIVRIHTAHAVVIVLLFVVIWHITGMQHHPH